MGMKWLQPPVNCRSLLTRLKWMADSEPNSQPETTLGQVEQNSRSVFPCELIVLPEVFDDGLKPAGKARDCCEGVNTATLGLICLAVALRRSALKELRCDLALRDHLPRPFAPL